MSKRELKQLAKLVFQMTRRQIWLGGNVKRKMHDWPEDVEPPQNWDKRVVWTMSPEVELGGHKIRVCVSAIPDRFWAGEGCRVRVFVDGVIGYPGGFYDQVDWTWLWQTWATRLARIEIEEGGRTGPVDRRDQLIVEAKDRLQTAQVKHIADPVDPDAEEAVREVEALVARRKVLRELS